jgi:hypothetical protein
VQAAERQATGYLSRVLASGARPFQFRAAAHTLLTGVGAAGQFGYSHAPPPAGFTYAQPSAPAELITGRGPEPFDAVVTAAKAAPALPGAQAPGSGRSRRPEPASGAVPHLAFDMERSGRAPSSSPVDSRTPAVSGTTSAFKARAAAETPGVQSKTLVLKVPEAASGAQAAVRELASGVQRIGARAEIQQPRNHRSGAVDVGSPAGSAPEDALARSTARGPERARENAPPPPQRLQRAAENAHRKAADFIPQELPPKQPVASAMDGPSIAVERIEAGDRANAASVRPAAIAAVRRTAFAAEDSQKLRAVHTLQQLRSSVQALVTKAVAAKAAPAEAKPRAPERPAARPPRKLIVARQSVDRQRHSPAFWERRHLGWAQLRVFR